MNARLERSEIAPADRRRYRLPRRRRCARGSRSQRRPAGGAKPESARPLRRRLAETRRGCCCSRRRRCSTWGYRFPTEQYITPQTGVGYALGIIGGSAMLLLLRLSGAQARPGAAFLGTTKRWFQAHMVLGIVGPVLVLFHSNFSLGATNSNVALACMLVVSGSGLFGRYFYTRIHHGLHGRKASLAELKEYAEKLRWVTTNVEFLPDLVARIEAEERRDRRALRDGCRCSRGRRYARVSVALARRRLRRHVRASLHDSGPTNAESARRRGPARRRRPATSTIVSPRRAGSSSSPRSSDCSRSGTRCTCPCS